MCNIHWPQIITNEELWKKTKQEKIEKQIKERKLRWTEMHQIGIPKDTGKEVAHGKHGEGR
jgi:hypothetical protein